MRIVKPYRVGDIIEMPVETTASSGEFLIGRGESDPRDRMVAFCRTNQTR